MSVFLAPVLWIANKIISCLWTCCRANTSRCLCTIKFVFWTWEMWKSNRWIKSIFPDVTLDSFVVPGDVASKLIRGIRVHRVEVIWNINLNFHSELAYSSTTVQARRNPVKNAARVFPRLKTGSVWARLCVGDTVIMQIFHPLAQNRCNWPTVFTRRRALCDVRIYACVYLQENLRHGSIHSWAFLFNLITLLWILGISLYIRL